MTTVVLVQQGGTGANSAAAARAALSVPSSSDVVSKSGDTMTGQLNVSSGGLIVQSNDSDRAAFIRSPTRTLRITPYYNSEGNDKGTWLEAINTSNAAYNKLTLSGSDLIFDATGNVGIGTSSPTANLHVTGTIKDTPIVSITGNQTYADNAAGKVIFSNTTSAVTVTIAAAATAGFSYTVIRGNTGNVTIANSGVTRLNSASITTMNLNQYGAATVVYTATNQVIVFGDFVA